MPDMQVVPHGSPQQQSQLSGVDKDTPMQVGLNCLLVALWQAPFLSSQSLPC